MNGFAINIATSKLLEKLVGFDSLACEKAYKQLIYESHWFYAICEIEADANIVEEFFLEIDDMLWNAYTRIHLVKRDLINEEY